MKRLRVGVVGTRRRAGCHIEQFQKNPATEVVAICDVVEARVKEYSQRFRIERIYTKYEDMLSDKNIDIIVLTTPDHLHGAQAISALENGKHVLTEIPLATTVDECKRISHLSVKTGLKVQMGNNVRWLSYLQAIRKLSSEGEFGEFFYAEAEYLHFIDPSRRIEDDLGAVHWRWTKGTTMLGGGPHAIDTIRWLLGDEEFIEVQAYGNKKVQSDRVNDDTTVAIFKGKSGIIAKVVVSYGVQRPFCLYFSLYGTKGTFEADRHGFGKEMPHIFTKRFPSLNDMIHLPIPHDDEETVKRQADDFIDAILKDHQPLINAKEAARSCIAGISALEAARLNKPVIIPEVGD